MITTSNFNTWDIKRRNTQYFLDYSLTLGKSISWTLQSILVYKLSVIKHGLSCSKTASVISCKNRKLFPQRTSKRALNYLGYSVKLPNDPNISKDVCFCSGASLSWHSSIYLRIYPVRSLGLSKGCEKYDWFCLFCGVV